MKAFLILLSLQYFIFNYAIGQTYSSEPDSLPVYHLNEIVILGERISSPLSITIDQIQKSTINTLDIKNASQALINTSGIYFSRNFRNQETFRLRGFEQRQISVFLDGIPISVPFDGIIDLSQLIGDDIESIRIAKCTGSILYGANTLGGTVNILSGTPNSSNSVKFRLEGSDQTRIFGDVQYENQFKNLSYLTSLTYDKATDFKLPANIDAIQNQEDHRRDNSSYEKKSAKLKVWYHINNTNHIGLNLHYIDNRFHVPPQLNTQRAHYWRFPEWKKYVVSLNSQHLISQKFLLRTVWFYDIYRNVLESFDDATYSTQNEKYAFTSIYNDYSLGIFMYPEFRVFSFGITKGLISLKKDTHREKSSENEPYKKYSFATVVFGLEQYIKFHRLMQASFGINIDYLKPLHAYNLNLRNPLSVLNGHLLFEYKIFTPNNIFLMFGKKSRFPTLKELYSERLGRNIPNTDLDVEHSLNAEIGIKSDYQNLSFKASLFYNSLENLITNVQLGDNIQQLQNIAKAILKGMELNMQVSLQNSIFDLNYTFLEAKNRSTNRDTDHLEYRPKHRINGIYHYNFTHRLYFQCEGNYTRDQYYQHPETTKWEKLNDFLLINLKVNYIFSDKLSGYFRTNNLFDKLYFSEFGIPMPGREFILGFRLEVF